MPERIYAFFPCVADQREAVQRMFLDAGLLDQLVEPSPALGLYRIRMPDDDAALRLTVAAGLHGIQQLSIHRHWEPSRKELAAAPLLVMRAGGPGAVPHRGHPRKGTSYDESEACPECGAGLRQTSPLVVLKTELPRAAHAAGIGDEVLFRDEAAATLEAAGLAGVSFREVREKSGAILPWRQLVVTATLPPMLAATRGMIRGRVSMERPCSTCGRDGWFDTPHDPFIPAYDGAATAAMPDAAWTHERWGTGAWATPVHGKRRLAERRLIVRPVVYATLTALRIRGLRFGLARRS